MGWPTPSMSAASEARAEAALFDGETAARRQVRVRPLAGGLRLSGEAELILARSELLLVEKGPPRTVLGRLDNPDWRLVAEPALPAEWLAGVATRAPVTKRAIRGWALLGGAVAALVALLWAEGDAMVAAAAPLVPAGVTEPMGVAFVDQLVGDRRCSTPEAEKALERLVAQLGPPRALTVTVADFGFANAFAGPGGQVVLTRGLLEQASGPDEVAGVLAHEIGHVVRHHPTQALLRHYGISLFAGSVGGGYAQVADVGLMLAATRGAEREADAYALERMRAAGISTAGLARFFERQQGPAKVAEEKGVGAELLAEIGSYATTHPPDAERLAAFRAGATADARPALTEAEWAALRAVCGAPKARSDG
jgi:Zn-dependent protease with chaperone function